MPSNDEASGASVDQDPGSVAELASETAARVAGDAATLASANAAAVLRTGNVGFYGTTPIGKPTVTGSRGGNAAVASLLTQLAALGLITDGSSA